MKMVLTVELDNKKKIELTEEEAKELYGKLNILFGEKKEYVPYPTYPSYPWIYYTSKPTFIPPYQITCGSSTAKSGDITLSNENGSIIYNN